MLFKHQAIFIMQNMNRKNVDKGIFLVSQKHSPTLELHNATHLKTTGKIIQTTTITLFKNKIKHWMVLLPNSCISLYVYA